MKSHIVVCMWIATILDISYAVPNMILTHMTTVPTNIPSNVELVNLTAGVLVLPNNAFAGLQNLKELYLVSNAIKNFPPTCVDGTRIEILDLSQNKLVEFGDYSYIQNTLSELILETNLISVIPNNLPSLLPKLEQLKLEENNITIFPANLVTNITEVIELQRNGLSDLPQGALSAGYNLKQLGLHNNPLAGFPNFTYLGLPLANNLQSIYMGSINVPTSSLPDDALYLPRLRSIGLAGVGLITFPNLHRQPDSESIAIGLNSNQLDRIPASRIRDAKINKLELRKNKFNSIPTLKGADLAYLKSINLAENIIYDVNETTMTNLINEAPNLETIELQDNFIETVSDLSTVLCTRAGASILEINLHGNQLGCDTLKWMKDVNCREECRVHISTDELCGGVMSAPCTLLRPGVEHVKGTSYWNESTFNYAADGDFSTCHVSGYESHAQITISFVNLTDVNGLYIKGGVMEDPHFIVRTAKSVKTCVHLIGIFDFTKGVQLACDVPLQGYGLELRSTYHSEAKRMEICELMAM